MKGGATPSPRAMQHRRAVEDWTASLWLAFLLVFLKGFWVPDRAFGASGMRELY
jgi:hypothetical protein